MYINRITVRVPRQTDSKSKFEKEGLPDGPRQLQRLTRDANEERRSRYVEDDAGEEKESELVSKIGFSYLGART
jgi:hypothetical protein